MSKECASECREGDPVNPWPKSQSFITMGLALAWWAIGVYALARENPRKLPALLAVIVAGATVARKELCARCPYYGQYCSMLIGKWTALIYERSDKPLTTFSYLLDGAVGGASALIPLPEVRRRSKLLFAAYLSLLAAFFGVSMTGSCRPCLMEGCPLKKILKAVGRAG